MIWSFGGQYSIRPAPAFLHIFNLCKLHIVKFCFYWCIERLFENDNHPFLRNKKIQGIENYWESSITMNYRCVYRKDQDTAFILEVGKHEDVF